jgi:hypothetical protein
VRWRKPETYHVNTIHSFNAGFGSAELAHITFGVFFPAIHVPAHAKAEFQVIFPGCGFFIMIYQHAGVFDIPLGVTAVPVDAVMDGTGYLLLPFLQKNQLVLHQGLAVCESKDVRGIVHSGYKFTKLPVILMVQL